MKKLFLIGLSALLFIGVNGQDPATLPSIGNAWSGRTVGRLNKTVERARDLSIVPYAALAFSDTSLAVSADSGVWGTITNSKDTLFSLKSSSNVTATGDTIVMQYLGGYDVNANTSFLLDTASTYEFGLFKNDSVLVSPKSEIRADSGVIVNVSLDWHITVGTVGDHYRLKLRNMSDDNDPTIISCSWVTIRRYWDRE